MMTIGFLFLKKIMFMAACVRAFSGSKSSIYIWFPNSGFVILRGQMMMMMMMRDSGEKNDEK